MNFKYRYFVRYTYDKEWTEVDKKKYDKAVALKPLWSFLSFEAKKRIKGT